MLRISLPTPKWMRGVRGASKQSVCCTSIPVLYAKQPTLIISTARVLGHSNRKHIPRIQRFIILQRGLSRQLHQRRFNLVDERETGKSSEMDAMLTTLMSETFHAILSRLVEAIGTLQTTGPSTLNSAYTALISVSPLFLIVLGVITFFAGALAKFIGVIIIIIGLVLLAIPYLGFIH